MTQSFRLYVDESGDHVFHDLETLRRAPHRYLALLGCFFADGDYRSFHDAFTRLKQAHFPHNPDEPVVLHRSDMINCRGPFWRLRDAEARLAFEEELLALVRVGRFRAVLVTIDKLALGSAYRTPWHPYHLALGFLLQRYCGYLNHENARGDVMAESRGRRENELLANAYEHVYVHGDRFHGAAWYRRALSSGKLKLKPKSRNITGLQLCDLLAYPLKQRYLVELGRLSDVSSGFGGRLASVAEAKLNRHLYDGRIEGYGRVMFPK